MDYFVIIVFGVHMVRSVDLDQKARVMRMGFYWEKFIEFECERLLNCVVDKNSTEVCAYHNDNGTVVRFVNSCVFHRYNCKRYSILFELNKQDCSEKDPLYQEIGSETSEVDQTTYERIIDEGCEQWEKCKNKASDGQVICAWSTSKAFFVKITECAMSENHCHKVEIFMAANNEDCFINTTGMEKLSINERRIAIFRTSECNKYYYCGSNYLDQINICAINIYSKTYVTFKNICVLHKYNCYNESRYLQTYALRCKYSTNHISQSDSIDKRDFLAYNKRASCRGWKDCEKSNVTVCAQNYLSLDYYLMQDECYLYKLNCEGSSGVLMRVNLDKCANVTKPILKEELMEVLPGFTNFAQRSCYILTNICSGDVDPEKWFSLVCAYDLRKGIFLALTSECDMHKMNCQNIGVFTLADGEDCDLEKTNSSTLLHANPMEFVKNQGCSQRCDPLKEDGWNFYQSVCAIDIYSGINYIIGSVCYAYELNCEGTKAFVELMMTGKEFKDFCANAPVLDMRPQNYIDEEVLRRFTEHNCEHVCTPTELDNVKVCAIDAEKRIFARINTACLFYASNCRGQIMTRVANRFCRRKQGQHLRSPNNYSSILTPLQVTNIMCKKLGNCDSSDSEICALDYNTGHFLKLKNTCQFYELMCNGNGMLFLAKASDCNITSTTLQFSERSRGITEHGGTDFVKQACKNHEKCVVQVEDREVCSYNYRTRRYQLLPNKCVFLQMNCEGLGKFFIVPNENCDNLYESMRRATLNLTSSDESNSVLLRFAQRACKRFTRECSPTANNLEEICAVNFRNRSHVRLKSKCDMFQYNCEMKGMLFQAGKGNCSKQ